MFYTYILENNKNKYYIGYTSKYPEERVLEHNQSKSKWTRSKGPWQLIYYERFETKAEALKREKQIKSYKGGKAFKLLLEKIMEGCPSG